MMGELRRRLARLAPAISRREEYLRKDRQQANRRLDVLELLLIGNRKEGESQAKRIKINQKWCGGGKSSVLPQGGLLPLQVSIEPQRLIIILSYYLIILLSYYPIIFLSYYLIILLSYYPIILLSYYPIILLSYYLIVLYSTLHLIRQRIIIAFLLYNSVG